MPGDRSPTPRQRRTQAAKRAAPASSPPRPGERPPSAPSGGCGVQPASTRSGAGQSAQLPCARQRGRGQQDPQQPLPGQEVPEAPVHPRRAPPRQRQRRTPHGQQGRPAAPRPQVNMMATSPSPRLQHDARRSTSSTLAWHALLATAPRLEIACDSPSRSCRTRTTEIGPAMEDQGPSQQQRPNRDGIHSCTAEACKLAVHDRPRVPEGTLLQ